MLPQQALHFVPLPLLLGKPLTRLLVFTESQNHIITELQGLEGTSKDLRVQPPTKAGFAFVPGVAQKWELVVP